MFCLFLTISNQFLDLSQDPHESKYFDPPKRFKNTVKSPYLSYGRKYRPNGFFRFVTAFLDYNKFGFQKYFEVKYWVQKVNRL